MTAIRAKPQQLKFIFHTDDYFEQPFIVEQKRFANYFNS